MSSGVHQAMRSYASIEKSRPIRKRGTSTRDTMDGGCTGPNSELQCEGFDPNYYEKRADATQPGDTNADTGTTGGNENQHYIDGGGVTVYVGSDGTKYRFWVI